MSLKFKQMRSASGYKPGKTPGEYEPLALHRVAQAPTYEKHTRTIRTLGPALRRDYAEKTTRAGSRVISGKRCAVVSRTVEKVIMSNDGRTPRHPILNKEGDPALEFVPVQAPIRLKKGTPKALYRLLKRLEKREGLDNIYARMARESGLPA